MKRSKGHNYLTREEMIEVSTARGISYRSAAIFANTDKITAPALGYKINTPEDYKAYCIKREGEPDYER